jgi:hypothetical protein
MISITILGFCFTICLLFATFSIAVVQKQLDSYFTNNTQYKAIFMLTALFIGLMTYPLFITIFHKGIWFFYFCVLGLGAQFFISQSYKIMPYSKLVTLYTLAIIYLNLQTDKYPIANFH